MRSTQPFVCLAIAVATAFAAPLPFPKPNGTDLTRLQGEWVCVLDMYEGRSLKVGDVRAAVHGKRIVFSANGKVTSTWTFTLDPGKALKEMDLREVVEDPLAASQSLQAVYRVDGDTLAIAFAVKGKGHGRPSGLEGRKRGEGLMAFKRR
jgi:uncharacterized protein (TIGR03067 family)